MWNCSAIVWNQWQSGSEILRWTVATCQFKFQVTVQSQQQSLVSNIWADTLNPFPFLCRLNGSTLDHCFSRHLIVCLHLSAQQNWQKQMLDQFSRNDQLKDWQLQNESIWQDIPIHSTFWQPIIAHCKHSFLSMGLWQELCHHNDTSEQVWWTWERWGNNAKEHLQNLGLVVKMHVPACEHACWHVQRVHSSFFELTMRLQVREETLDVHWATMSWSLHRPPLDCHLIWHLWFCASRHQWKTNSLEFGSNVAIGCTVALCRMDICLSVVGMPKFCVHPRTGHNLQTVSKACLLLSSSELTFPIILRSSVLSPLGMIRVVFVVEQRSWLASVMPKWKKDLWNHLASLLSTFGMQWAHPCGCCCEWWCEGLHLCITLMVWLIHHARLVSIVKTHSCGLICHVAVRQCTQFGFKAIEMSWVECLCCVS